LVFFVIVIGTSRYPGADDAADPGQEQLFYHREQNALANAALRPDNWASNQREGIAPMDENEVNALRRERSSALFMGIALRTALRQAQQSEFEGFDGDLDILIRRAEARVQQASAKLRAAGEAFEAPLLMMGGEA
jgi:hypothetical protein